MPLLKKTAYPYRDPVDGSLRIAHTSEVNTGSPSEYDCWPQNTECSRRWVGMCRDVSLQGSEWIARRDSAPWDSQPGSSCAWDLPVVQRDSTINKTLRGDGQYRMGGTICQTGGTFSRFLDTIDIPTHYIPETTLPPNPDFDTLCCWNTYNYDIGKFPAPVFCAVTFSWEKLTPGEVIIGGQSALWRAWASVEYTIVWQYASRTWTARGFSWINTPGLGESFFLYGFDCGFTGSITMTEKRVEFGDANPDDPVLQNMSFTPGSVSWDFTQEGTRWAASCWHGGF